MDIRNVSGIQANRPTPASAVPTPQSVADATAPTSQTPPNAATQPTAGSPSDPVVVAGGYISPVLRYDQDARLAVIYFRDRSSGETQNQIPAQQVVEEYRRTASRLGGATDAAEDRGAGKGPAPSGGAGRNAGPGFGAALRTGIPSGETPPAAASATAGTIPAAVSAAPRAAGAYGAGSPGAIVSVTV
ncbi:hypothetical protein FBZ83_115117 [Azospirillum brasilense]|uniref:Uncharacterized protein n=1 Tax=Azospirillum brasilense TaxID=192 RepID=A0A560BYL8_AZOBR|nr:hypothetical protein [Azospirillum brasilense]TWA77639.1 hypothetical protein FBZ83_115117 [Azospirillum brasilense]